MYTASKYDTSNYRILIDFTKSGSRDFRRLNTRNGRPIIPFSQLERDLAEYIERHRDAGHEMIAEFDVRYDDGVMLTVFLSGGIYYIKGMTAIGEVVAHAAVLVWKQVKRGCSYLMCQVIAGWYFIPAPMPAAAC